MSLVRNIDWFRPINDRLDESLLIYAACDSKYLSFGTALVNSVEVFSPGHSFLLHLINPSADDLKQVDSLAGSLSSTRLFISMESIDLSAFTSAEQVTYYACARFLHLAELLPQLARPVLCLDAD